MVSLDERERTEGRGEGGRQWLGRFISPTEDLATERGRWEDRGNAMPFRSMSGRQPYRKQSSKCVQDVGRVCRISIPTQPLSKRIRNCVVAQQKLFHALTNALQVPNRTKKKAKPEEKAKTTTRCHNSQDGGGGFGETANQRIGSCACMLQVAVAKIDIMHGTNTEVNKGLYVVARNFFLLLLNCSAWPCLAVA